MKGLSRLVCLVFLIGQLCGAAPVQAQIFPVPAPGRSSAPFDTRQEGLYATASVDLDGSSLFRVAAVGTTATAQLVAATRAMTVDAALQSVVAIDAAGAPLYDASTLRIQTRHVWGQDAIEAVDAHHPDLMIVTVTSADAKAQQSTVDDVAAKWRAILQDAIVDALRKREPAVERRHLGLIVRVATVLALGTILLLLALRLLRRRIGVLTDELTRYEESGDTQTLPALALQRSNLKHRLRFVSASAGALVWLILLSWFIAATWALGLFSQTTALSRALSRGGTAVGVIWFAAGMTNRLGDLAISRIAASWRIRHNHLTSEEEGRAILRVPTIANALAGFKAFALTSLAIVLTFGQLGLPIASVVTISSVVALAITFATQNFLRDFAGGLAVLFEDQYAVGDCVTINGQTGVVEHLTLRMVRIRDVFGSAVTISHSAVTSVLTHSRIWSRIDYRVSIDPAADPEAAIKVIQATVEEMVQDPDSRDSVLLPIEWIGIDAFTKDWTLIRASIRTAYISQFTLRREINGRLRRRLAEAGIAFGPQIEAQYVPPI